VTPPNPFVELARNPVGTLALAGYALGLLALSLMSTWWSLRTIGRLGNRWRANHHTDDWWSGPFEIGFVPPPKWSATFCAVLFVWAVTAWALSALVWIAGGGA
jgi:hypothetical protein